MSERFMSPDHFSSNRAYEAILGNQQLWTETHPGFKYGHELKALSGKIEKSLKRVFSGYIDPGYPQIAINFTFGYHPKAYTDEYTYTPFRFPKHMSQADQSDYKTGMFELNEWATAYATSYYWKAKEKGTITKPLIKGYRSFNHSFIDKGSAPRATKTMEEVAKIARLNTFEHATFRALFNHDTSALDYLISNTESVQSNSLEELAIEIVRRPKKKLADVVMGYGSQSKESDSRIKSVAKHAAMSAASQGWQATPGIVEVNLAMGMTGPTLGGSISATGNIGAAGLFGTALTSFSYPSTTIHEAIHGYSLSETHHGIMPISLIKN